MCPETRQAFILNLHRYENYGDEMGAYIELDSGYTCGYGTCGEGPSATITIKNCICGKDHNITL